MAVRHHFGWVSTNFCDGYPIREIISNIGQSYFLSAGRTRSCVGRRVYQRNGRQDSRKRNREPFWSRSRYRRPNRILHVRLSYSVLRPASTLPRCFFYPSIRRARVISSFLYLFSLLSGLYSTRFLRKFRPSSSKNIRNGSSSLSLSLSKEIAGRF